MCTCLFTSMSEDKEASTESCLYLPSILCHQHVLIIYILHNCRSICCVSVGMKYKHSPPSKEETGHFAGSRRCVKPLGWKNLEKTEYPGSTFEKADPTVYFRLLIFNLIIWYQALASDGFFLLSNA